ncbi:hypothetical protein F2P81_014572 [Scophthalmus maximus]|uniref:Uncharacterized protein n=1 Tax=Scophthalmus maximus TaxID=52904 RepID=A0A6A4SPP8_SCOMX|nr:hypothetical protein F2P81_014572 [Scophthalmus maximus]
MATYYRDSISQKNGFSNIRCTLWLAPRPALHQETEEEGGEHQERGEQPRRADRARDSGGGGGGASKVPHVIGCDDRRSRSQQFTLQPIGSLELSASRCTVRQSESGEGEWSLQFNKCCWRFDTADSPTLTGICCLPKIAQAAHSCSTEKEEDDDDDDVCST